MITAVCRGRHRDLDPVPHVPDDRHALDLVAPSWSAVDAMLGRTLPEPARSRMRAAMVVRSRYVEDRLLHRGLRR